MEKGIMIAVSLNLTPCCLVCTHHAILFPIPEYFNMDLCSVAGIKLLYNMNQYFMK